MVANPKKTTLHDGQSRSWSAEQGKEIKRKSLAAYPPPPLTLPVRRKINKITRSSPEWSSRLPAHLLVRSREFDSWLNQDFNSFFRSGKRENASRSNSTIGWRVVRVLNLHRDKNSEGVNRGEMGRSLVTTGRME